MFSAVYEAPAFAGMTAWKADGAAILAKIKRARAALAKAKTP
jgi:hypothetical protein